jgi:hypothetical protein
VNGSPTPGAAARARELARAIDAVCDLQDKYRRLEALAREPPATAPGPYAQGRKRRKRALAERFPGALRELDRLPASALRARSDALERYLEGLLSAARTAGWSAPPPDLRWITWSVELHALTRALLKVKRIGRTSPPARVRALLAEDPDLGLPTEIFTDDLIAEALTPPRGRILDLVYRVLAARHGVPASEIREALFPPIEPEK